MSTMVPVFSDTGVKGSLPEDQVANAIKERGFKIAVRVTSPEGLGGWMPQDKVADAIKDRGFKVGQLAPNQPEDALHGALQPFTPDMGTVKKFGSDLADTAKSAYHTFTDEPKSLLDIPAVRLAKGYYKSVQAANEAAKAEADKGNTGASMTESVAAGLPVLGPLLHGTYGASGGLGASRILQAASMAPDGSLIPNPASLAVEGLGKGVSAAWDVARRGVQELMNVGPRATTKATAQVQELNKAVLDDHDAKLADYENKYQKALTSNAKDVNDWKAKVDEVKAQNAQDLAEHKQTVDTLTKLNEERQSQVAQRAQHVNDITNNGSTLATGLKDLEKSVRAQGSAKFEAVAQAVGDAKANPAPLREAVQHAERNIIAGSPESIKQFKSILGDTTPESSVSTSMGELPSTHPLYAKLMAEGAIEAPPSVGWRDLQGYYTELGQKIGTQQLPGDVYRALKYVQQEGIGKEMQRMAEAKGAGEGLAAARQFWRQYSQTFHDMRPVSQGGSPVARAYRAIDPDYAVAPFVGKASGRAIDMVAKYDPKLADVARDTTMKFNGLKQLPSKFTEKAIPAAPTPKSEPNLPNIKSMPLRPTKPTMQTVDPQAVKQAAVEKIADKLRGGGGWGFSRDAAALGSGTAAAMYGHPLIAAGLMAYPIMRRAVGAGLERPSFMQWVTKPTQAELGPTVKAQPTPTSVAKYTSPTAVMLAMKNGELSNEQGTRILQKMGGKNTVVTRPLTPPPP